MKPGATSNCFRVWSPGLHTWRKDRKRWQANVSETMATVVSGRSAAHRKIHASRSFTPGHFERWLTLFRDTVELGWVGARATAALELAGNVARVHRHQLIGERDTVDPSPLDPARSTASARSGSGR